MRADNTQQNRTGRWVLPTALTRSCAACQGTRRVLLVCDRVRLCRFPVVCSKRGGSMSDPTPRSLDPLLTRRRLLASGVAGAAGLYGLSAARAAGAVPTALLNQLASGTVPLTSHITR